MRRLILPFLISLSACQGKIVTGDKGMDDSLSGDSLPADSGTGTPDDGDSPTVESQPDSAGDSVIAPVLGKPIVILFIGDGMGQPHVAGGGLFKNGAAGSLTLETLPNHAFLRTASFSGTTDSAASGTAMAAGTKTENGMLGLDRAGGAVMNVREVAKARGLATGVVTTDTLLGATPSSFLVHVEDRGDQLVIAEQFLLNLPDVALGGGTTTLSPLIAGLDVQALFTADDLAAFVDDGRPVVGVFAPETFPFVSDGATGLPTLADMTRAALEKLDGDPDGLFLMVEGARIDHASHANLTNSVYPEVLAFDEAIAETLAWAEGRDNVTILVSADHECGGLAVEEGTGAGVIPTSTWRWKAHSNWDVHLYGMGEASEAIDGQRLDNTWIHSVLLAAVEGTTPEPSTLPFLPDGTTDDLGPPVSTQLWETDFGAGYNQLDALHLTADENGLWIGVDGVFQQESNAVVVLLDRDYGAATGVGVDAFLSDVDSPLDMLVSGLNLSVPAGFAHEAAIGTLGAFECTSTEPPNERSGFRGLAEDLGAPDNLSWVANPLVFDDGNVSINGALAPDAGATGATVGGMETWVPWTRLFPGGIPAAGTSIAVTVFLTNADGTQASNQILPAPSSEPPSGGAMVTVEKVAVLDVGADGLPLREAYLGP